MIKLGWSDSDSLLTVELSGRLSDAELNTLGDEMKTPIAHASKAKALIDWSGLGAWKAASVKTPPANLLAAGQALSRVALLHEPCWNSHAAWLAAILRRGGGQVRSWRPSDGALALTWLLQTDAVDLPEFALRPSRPVRYRRKSL